MWKPSNVLAAWLLCMPLSCLAQVAQRGPADVHVVQVQGRYQLQVDGKPFYVKGGGMAGTPQQQDALAARGGNSFRTWHTGENRSDVVTMLDHAQRSGLKVAMGIEVARERHGFDYDDAKAVDAQRARIRREVLAYKDHPAVLMWVVGNELNLEGKNPAVWTAVGQLADMIHTLDPHHPVMTTLAGFDKPLIEAIKQRAPSLDLIGIQLYGDISALPEKLKTSGWTGPYIVTEWGPTGHWESPLTTWGAPIEDTATRKAQLLTERYQRYIASDTRQALGSYVFLWGNKQERTPTWYGLFLPSGESTPSVDAMQQLWTGKPAANRAPSIAVPTIDGQLAQASVTVAPGSEHAAKAASEDPDGDALHYQWSVRAESTARTVGGDPEDVPAQVDVRISETANGAMRFVAPTQPGAYRLFVEVRDEHGHAAYANFPFRVQAKE
ncbi:glycoside hydrolase family 2 TIM barrel-domain containing protein [Pseudoxanthomonas sp. GM95]|uniref:glycoside hydrolase family 2 TIM barrel-domain containing protein n=1 Tax=Pseudoxanthomonas sp. GM95 TaxID=1881043 RepID=UPI0031B5DA00